MHNMFFRHTVHTPQQKTSPQNPTLHAALLADLGPVAIARSPGESHFQRGDKAGLGSRNESRSGRIGSSDHKDLKLLVHDTIIGVLDDGYGAVFAATGQTHKYNKSSHPPRSTVCHRLLHPPLKDGVYSIDGVQRVKQWLHDI